jgi:hypothetical protein
MLNQYVKVFSHLCGRGPKKPNSERDANTPRTSNFSSRRYKRSAKSKEDEIFGTGRQWGAVESSVESRGDMPRTESQENIMEDNKGIQRTVDVEMWHTDGRSDESLKI